MLRAVLFDRDGTLVHDVPYNSDPQLVVAFDSARSAVARVRQAGLAVGVVTNQSGVASGRITLDSLAAVNARIDDLVGPFDIWLACIHASDDQCACRKPRPGMILEAAERLDVLPCEIAVIGDIGSDMQAAMAAGAQCVLVPTSATRPQEVAAAATVAPDLNAAVELLLAGPTYMGDRS